MQNASELSTQAALDAALLQSTAHTLDMVVANGTSCFLGRWCSLAESVEQLGKGKRIFLPSGGSPFVLKVNRSPKPAEQGVQAEHAGLVRLSTFLLAAGCHAAAARVPFTSVPFRLNFTDTSGARARVRTLYAVLQQHLEGALFKCTRRHNTKLDRMWLAAFAHASRAAALGRAPAFTREGAYEDVRNLRVASLEPLDTLATVVSELLLWARALADARLSIVDMQFLVGADGRMWLFDPKHVDHWVTHDSPGALRDTAVRMAEFALVRRRSLEIVLVREYDDALLAPRDHRWRRSCTRGARRAIGRRSRPSGAAGERARRAATSTAC